MTNIEQQIANLEQQLAILKQNMQELAKKKQQEASNMLEASLLKKPVPGSRSDFWRFDNDNGLEPSNHYASPHDHGAYSGGSIFQSEPLAQAYAEAIETMLLLRHQPGSCSVNGSVAQYIIEPNDDGELYVDGWQGVCYQLRCISPCFRTEELAQQAIETVGKERILKMFRTFHGLEGY